ncbi:hypothetical protein PR202_gb16357 [Eleusine coracana subsp. coracana]|uniref:Late embryogenesis abundant protein LEA-2 subgroup domain-containing protein n=1 Tax=Eleusine coracana subsp. coracana TaxID=191504 RepID=A0AAV5F0T7_ELECO|nr:hypothetical protein PR202_gb16357 [Eleusine coracana subsp. coracana]
MQPSSSSSAQPPDHPDRKSPPPPAPAMGYPANTESHPQRRRLLRRRAAPRRRQRRGFRGRLRRRVPVPRSPAAPPTSAPSRVPPPVPAAAPPLPGPPAAAHLPAPPPRARRRRVPPPRRAATFIVWLLLRPRTPAFSLTSLNLSRVVYAPTNSTLSASFDAALLASNPNSKLSVTYFSPLASVSITPSSPLAVASLPPFSQGPGNTTTLAFRVAVEDAYVGPDDAAALKSGSGGTAEVEVRLAAVAVFDRGGWRTRRRVMRVMCDRVPVVFRGKNSTEASFSGPARRCDVVL